MTTYNPKTRALLLRTCLPDMTSPSEKARGFRWPESGPVEAPDWDGGKPVCGGKLHGFLWGEGSGELALWDSDTKWLVVAADPADVVEITERGGGKHGFRRGEVVFCGDREAATTFIIANGAIGKAVMGATVSAGNRGTALAGYRGMAIAGDYGAATAGDSGTAIAGRWGLAKAGDRGNATVGYGGTAMAGYRGMAMAGETGMISLLWWDHIAFRMRRKTGRVGDGIEANKPYKLVSGEFVACNIDEGRED